MVFGVRGIDGGKCCLTHIGDGGTTTVEWFENRRAAVRKDN